MNLEPLRPFAVLIGCVGFCIFGAGLIEILPDTKDGFRGGNPPRPGIYRTKLDKQEHLHCFNYWDGHDWYVTGSDETEAIRFKSLGHSVFQAYLWKPV